MKASGYVVLDESKAGAGYLELVGPFAYPKWGSIVPATVLTFAQAHAFATAYGSKDARIVAADAEKIRAAQASGWGMG